MPSPQPLIAIVLPPREGFGRGRAGAIGLLVRRHAAASDVTTIVFGGKQDGDTFPKVDFRPAAPAIWPPASSNVRYAATIADALRKLSPALVEVHNRADIALAIASRLPATKVALFLHNDPQDMKDLSSPTERATALRRLAFVATPSDYLRKRFTDGVTEISGNAVVLPNCLDLSELPPPQNRERLILFAGRIVAEKGPDAFVSACASAMPHLSGWGAEMIGADRFFSGSPDTNFVQMIRGAADGSGVRMLGYRDHTEVLTAMSRASIVVVPSRWPEPFGLVALEALASGASLICSPRGGLPEVAGDCAVYADPDKPMEIAAAIRTLAKDDRRRAELARMGRERARWFDMPTILKHLAELRNAVLAG